MSAGFGIEELAEVLRVDEVAVDRHGDTVGRVDVERLGLGAITT